jgi:hypothetical protein
MPGNYTLRRTYVDGDILSAADYVADHQQHIDNQTPQGTDDYSANVTQMRVTTSPGTVNGESLATSLGGELERIRFVLKDIKTKINGSAVLQWYDVNYTNLPGNSTITAAKLADGATHIQYLRNTNGSPGAIGADAVVVSQAIVMTRSRVRIRAFCNISLAAANANVTFRLKRGATTIATHPDFVVASDTGVYMEFLDNPGAGTYTYGLFAEKTAGAGTPNSVSSEIAVEEVA